MKKTILATLVIAVVFTTVMLSCDTGGGSKDPAHTHDWEWVVTIPATIEADGLETETCKTCGAINGTRPIAKLELETKTFPITLKDGALKFTVEYKAYPTDAEPAYLTYIKERLEVIVASDIITNVNAVNALITNGGSNHTITVEYTGSSYEGIKWNATSRTFTIHNDWITTATDIDLSLLMLRAAFNAVEAE